jgi:sulfonate transport system ATP-binding protein
MMHFEASIETMQFSDTPHAVRSPMLRKLLLLQPIKQDRVLIQNLTLNAASGEVISLVGASGAGKTTLLRILAGLETQFVGHVNLDGESVKMPSRKIQVVFQDNRLLPWLNVESNVAFAIANEDRTTREEKTRVWLKKVGLADKAKALPKTLSGGEASRVAFARAFVDPPKLLLLDEPFRALDPMTKLELQDELLTFAREFSTTVLLVSHSVDDAVFLSDKVLVLAKDPLRIFRKFRVPNKRPRQRGDSSLVTLSTRVIEALRETLGQIDDAGGLGPIVPPTVSLSRQPWDKENGQPPPPLTRPNPGA